MLQKSEEAEELKLDIEDLKTMYTCKRWYLYDSVFVVFIPD